MSAGWDKLSCNLVVCSNLCRWRCALCGGRSLSRATVNDRLCVIVALEIVRAHDVDHLDTSRRWIST